MLGGGRTAGLIARNDTRLTFGKHSLHCADKSIRFKTRLYCPTELLQRAV